MKRYVFNIQDFDLSNQTISIKANNFEEVIFFLKEKFKSGFIVTKILLIEEVEEAQ